MIEKSVLVAVYPFKGTYTGVEAAEAIARQVRALGAEWHVELRPLGDGGGGTLDALLGRGGMGRRRSMVQGMEGERADVEWGVRMDGTAIIEAARVVGLAGIPRERRDPLGLSTRGIGELLMEAAGEGLREVWIGLGDTATHDCGIGMASALGWRFLDAEGRDVEPIGRSLPSIAAIDGEGVPDVVRRLRVTALCDVLNPLTGPDGAAQRFLSQKGGTVDDIGRMEEAAQRFAQIVESDRGVVANETPGAGAAGGLGFGIATFLKGELTGGAALVLDTVGINKLISRSSLVITGEGRVDRGTLLGKGAALVVARAVKQGVPALIVTGSVDGDREEFERMLGAPILTLDDGRGGRGGIEGIGERLREEVGRG
jgi:glycerate kinase